MRLKFQAFRVKPIVWVVHKWVRQCLDDHEGQERKCTTAWYFFLDIIIGLIYIWSFVYAFLNNAFWVMIIAGQPVTGPVVTQIHTSGNVNGKKT